MQSCYYPHSCEHIATGTAKVQPSCSQNRNRDVTTNNALLPSTDVFAKSLFCFLYLQQAGEARKEIHNPQIYLGCGCIKRGYRVQPDTLQYDEFQLTVSCLVDDGWELAHRWRQAATRGVKVSDLLYKKHLNCACCSPPASLKTVQWTDGCSGTWPHGGWKLWISKLS